MSVYNTEESWLRQSIESILSQSLRDFEFVIIIDCPTDNSADIIKKYAEKDHRIHIIENKKNYGLTRSLNFGLEVAQGKYIARMDADDISLPNRLEKQVLFLEEHENVVAVGSWCFTSNSRSPVLNDWINDHELMRIRMLFRNAGLPHPTAMIRKSVLRDNGICYTESIKKSQDYKLWVDLMPFGDLVLMPEILFLYREHESQASAHGASLSYAHQIAIGQAEELLGPLSEKEKDFHCTATELRLPDNDVVGFANYLDKLITDNKKKGLYDQKKFKLELDYIWCQKAFRRLKLDKNADMLMTMRTLRFLNPRLFEYIKDNKRRTKEYIKAINVFRNKEQHRWFS